MTAATLTGPALRERLKTLLDHASYGVIATRPASDEEAARLRADEAGLAMAFWAVHDAASDGEARKEVLKCLIGLTDGDVEQWAAALAALRVERKVAAMAAADGGN